MTDQLAPGAPSDVRPSAQALNLARAAEQLALAAASVILASRIGPQAFAPVGILLVVNSLGVTLADFGLGLRVLRLEPRARLNQRSLRSVRLVNGAAFIAAASVAAVMRSGATTLIATCAALWLLSGETTTRKAAALRGGRTPSVAIAEVCGASVLAASVALAVTVPSVALPVVGAGLVGKQLLELIAVRPWRWAFGDECTDRDWFGLWGSQALAFVISNIDYVMIGAFFGERVLAIYIVAYRIASGIPSQAAYVAGRTVTVDLVSGSGATRQAKYDRYCRVLFAIGLVGALATVSASPLFAKFLGEEWSGAGPTLAVLVIAAPWRIILGTAGTLAIISGRGDLLLRWELMRVVLVALTLAAAAALGFGMFLAAVVTVPIVSAVVYHRLAAGHALITPWTPLLPAAAVTMLALVAGLALGWETLGAMS